MPRDDCGFKDDRQADIARGICPDCGGDPGRCICGEPPNEPNEHDLADDLPKPPGGNLSETTQCGAGWMVSVWVAQLGGYAPAGEIVQNYRPYEEWADRPAPIRDGFRAKSLNDPWSAAQVFPLFRDAQAYCVNFNPYGVAPF